MTATAHVATVREVVPLLFVRDIRRSVEFYQRLGFHVATQADINGTLGWCRIERDRAALMLQQDCPEDAPAGERGRGVVFYFICDDADALHAELSARGLSPDAPTTAYYGMRQFRMPDPDGYDVWFESPTA